MSLRVPNTASIDDRYNTMTHGRYRDKAFAYCINLSLEYLSLHFCEPLYCTTGLYFWLNRLKKHVVKRWRECVRFCSFLSLPLFSRSVYFRRIVYNSRFLPVTSA